MDKFTWRLNTSSDNWDSEPIRVGSRVDLEVFSVSSKEKAEKFTSRFFPNHTPEFVLDNDVKFQWTWDPEAEHWLSDAFEAGSSGRHTVYQKTREGATNFTKKFLGEIGIEFFGPEDVP